MSTADIQSTKATTESNGQPPAETNAEAQAAPGSAGGSPAVSADAARLELLTINTIRTLAMDAVQKAVSGHPGTPMALAPVAYALWYNLLRYDPEHPGWPNRDRFVLSCGQASMLLYSLLHLAGVKQFDQHGD